MPCPSAPRPCVRIPRSTGKAALSTHGARDIQKGPFGSRDPNGPFWQKIECVGPEAYFSICALCEPALTLAGSAS